MSSAMPPHEEIEELVAADALDGLDAGDRERMVRLMAAHGPDCPECRRLVSEYAEVAAGIGLTLPPEPLAPRVEEALLREAVEGTSQPRSPSARPLRRPARVRWMVPVAAAAALALVAGVIGYALAPGRPALRSLVLQGQLPGQLTLVYQPGQPNAVLVGSGLPDPGPGTVYELWYQPSPGADMRPAGVFTPTDGSLRTPVRVGSSFVLVAVTREPAPRGSPSPTSTPVLSAPA